MPLGRQAAAGAVVGGKLYVLGGVSATGTEVATMIRYDPVTNAWSNRAAMSSPRSGLGGAAVKGILYAVGGLRSGTILKIVEAYTP